VAQAFEGGLNRGEPAVSGCPPPPRGPSQEGALGLPPSPPPPHNKRCSCEPAGWAAVLSDSVNRQETSDVLSQRSVGLSSSQGQAMTMKPSSLEHNGKKYIDRILNIY